METTRDQILRFVRARREANTAAVAEAVGLSQAAVRRHLDSLRADGLIDARLERHGVGRPTLVFFPTELGEEAGAHGYMQLLSRLIRRLEKLDASEVGGSSGREVLERAFEGVAYEVAAAHQVEVRGETLEERVREASRALEREGIVDDWNKEGDVYRLINNECPYLRLAEASDAPCRSDLKSIELLVGAPVDLRRRIADRDPICEYIVRTLPRSIENKIELAEEKS